MADRYWVGGSGNWLDAANHWSDVSGGTTDASFLPTENDDVYFVESSLPSSISIGITTNTGDHRCKSIYATGLLSKYVYFTASYYNVFWIYGSVNVDSHFSLKGMNNYYISVYFKSSYAETITLNGGSIHRIIMDNPTGKITFQDASYSLSQVYFVGGSHGEVDLNSATFDIDSFQFSNADSIITCGSSVVTIQSSLQIGIGVVLNSGTSTFILNVTYYKGIMLGCFLTQEFYNFMISSTSTSGSHATVTTYTYTADGGLRVTNTLTIAGYDRKNMILFTKYGNIGLNTGYNTTFTINADTLVVSYISFCNTIFTGNGNYDFSSNDTVGDCGFNINALFISPLNAYYYQNGGNLSEAKWYTETNGGGVPCRVPLPHDMAVIDANSCSEPTTLIIDIPVMSGLDTSNASQDISLVYTAVDLIHNPQNTTQLYISNSFFLDKVVSFTSSNLNWYLNFFGLSKTINLNDLVISAYYLNFNSQSTQTFELTGGFTSKYVSGVLAKIKFNSHLFDFGTANFGTAYCVLGSSTIYIHSGTNYIGAALVQDIGTSKLYINPNTSGGITVQGRSNSKVYWYDVEIIGDNTGEVIFNRDLDVNELKIAAGFKVKFYSKYYDNWKDNFFNTLILNGVAGNLITLRGNLQTFTQFYLVKKSIGNLECEYVDLQDCNLTGQYNVKKIDGVLLGYVKQITATAKTSAKRIMGVLFKAVGIATHSVDNGNNTGWNITP